MPSYGENYRKLTPTQLHGSEYGGADHRERLNSLQPKGQDALTAADLLRLGYTVGSDADPLQLNAVMSLEDRRQMLGLKPAGDRRPNWLAKSGRAPYAEIEGLDYGVLGSDDDEVVGE